MGRTKTAAETKGRKNASPTRTASKNQPSVPDLLAKAQSLMAEMDAELARRFVARILEMEPNHFEAREMLGIIEAEEGNIDAARKLFASLVHPSPTARSPPSHSAYLYLAQLTDSDPREALSHYQSAVDQLIVLIKGKERIPPLAPSDPADPDPDSEAGLKRTLISALVAMVEIWMTSDLCMEPEAEKTCDRLASLALSSDPDNIEAFDCLASVRLSQSRDDEAKQIVEKGIEVFGTLSPDDPRFPPISCLLSLARRSLELSLYPQALQVLRRVMTTDDEEIDAWYLQGWCFFLMAQQVRETGQEIEELGWQELAQDARDCLETCKNLYAQGEHDDEELAEHVKDLISQLHAEGINPSLDLGDGDEGEDREDGEDAWEDEDSDVEMG